MKYKNIIFGLPICFILILLISNLISLCKIKASGVSYTIDPRYYYYAPNYIQFESDLFSAYVDFITPFDERSGTFETGIYEKNNVFYNLQTDLNNIYGVNTDLLSFGGNGELFFYLDEMYDLDDVDKIRLVWQDVVITNNSLEYAPTFGYPYVYNVDISYYRINDSGELVLVNHTYSINGGNEIFNSLFSELNISEIAVDKMSVEITSLQSAKTFNLYMALVDGTNRSMIGTDQWLFDNNEFEFPTMLGWLTNSISSFLNTSFIGSITIGHLLLLVLCIPLTIALLKFFVGG